MGVVELIGGADHAPGVGVVAVQAGHSGAVGQVIFPLDLYGGAGVRIGIHLAGQTVAPRAVVEKADRPVRIRQVSGIGDDLKIHVRDEILGENLREAAAIGAGQRVSQPRNYGLIGGAVVFADPVVRV